MSQVRVRSKNQITIPARIAALANIRPDDLLEITCKNGVITLTPATRAPKQQSALSYAGIARGTWGETTDEIEAELKESRDSWDR
ncbi:MAG: AbrB/MazE/SpoVT family DNA-binding domain-containing protein [Chlorobaculum sp.]|jgi:AbrB family looped-hinge helix DNA binding protein|nr:AbrB/MazE/SpoVT family DNA-binding domain-containing protein [Chlorobaculum sp.]